MSNKFKERTKNLSRKQKFDYYWNYYRFYALAIIVGLAVVGDIFYSYYTAKETIFYGAFVNALPTDDEVDKLTELFIEKAEIDINESEFFLDSTLYVDLETDNSDRTGQQKLITLIAAANLDLIGTDETTFKYFAYDDAFLDLTTCLSQEEIEKYEPYFYYIDKKALDIIHSDTREDFYDYVMPSKYEEMDTPIPVGICVSEEHQLGKSYMFKGKNGVIGIVQNTKRINETLDFISVGF